MSPIPVATGNKIGTLPFQFPHWSASFDVNPTGTIDELGNIFQIGNNPIALNPFPEIPTKKWTKIEISQVPDNNNYIYTVKVGGETVQTVTNSQPKTFANAEVYATGPSGTAGQAEIRDVRVHTQG